MSDKCCQRSKYHALVIRDSDLCVSEIKRTVFMYFTHITEIRVKLWFWIIPQIFIPRAKSCGNIARQQRKLPHINKQKK